MICAWAIYLCSKNTCNSTKILKYFFYGVPQLCFCSKNISQLNIRSTEALWWQRQTYWQINLDNYMTQNLALYFSLWAIAGFKCMKAMLDMCFLYEIYSETQWSQDRSTKAQMLLHSSQHNKWLNSHAEMWELVTNILLFLSRTLRISEQLLKAAEIKGNYFIGTSAVSLLYHFIHMLQGSYQLLPHWSCTWKWDMALTPIMEQMGKCTNNLTQQP